MECPRCKIKLEKGIALVDQRHTCFSSGDPKMEDVLKCPRCGFSRTAPLPPQAKEWKGPLRIVAENDSNEQS